MKIEIRYIDASEEDCRRTDVEAISPITGETINLAAASLRPHEDALERARALWGCNVKLVDADHA